MRINTKRWNDPQDPSDGTRILVSRYRPRGVRKEDETWTQWLPHLGPSAPLHAAVYGRAQLPITWTTYRTAYLREMQLQKPAIAALAQRVANGETITLMCSSACIREDRCHRSLLKALIETALKRAPP